LPPPCDRVALSSPVSVYRIAGNSSSSTSTSFRCRRSGFPNPTLKHYNAAFIERPFRNTLNSLIIAVAHHRLAVLGTMAGYALARFQYPGRWRYQISFWILSTRMMPPIVTIIPLYVAFNYLDMLNTKRAVAIAYTAFNLPFATWMMKSYFQDLPVELEEAAIVDGDTRWGAFLRVALPLARPGLAATAIFCLIVSWNEFLLALVLTLTAKSQTLPIGIAGRVTQYTTYWGEISAAGLPPASHHDLRPDGRSIGARIVIRRGQG
jgi:multiple sugar transport system permease protein